MLRECSPEFIVVIKPVLVVLPDNVHYLAQTVGKNLTLI